MQADDVFNYDVLSDQEIQQERGILTEGTYNFEVSKAEKKVSKTSGNPMVMLKLKVWDLNGKTYTVTDFLIASRKMAWKTKHFWESVGEPEKYNGQFSISELIGKSGLVKTVVEKDNNGFDQAKVQDYVTNRAPVFNAAPKAETTPALDEMDDDIPF